MISRRRRLIGSVRRLKRVMNEHRSSWNAVTLSLLALITTGCSRVESDLISVGDSMQLSRAKLVAWGGQEAYLARYTVTVPVAEDTAKPTGQSDPYVATVPAWDEDQERDNAPERYEVVDPRTQPCDGYSFADRIIVLHGNETVSDIEIVVYGDGGKSTERTFHGNRVLTRSDLVQ
ncbi:hypothetical protein CA13_73640 [Planctomycetes bacterium CA13]|uniref:Uncharacterized protein n=1 Tax=Novipirellula herctigrandis TaxID=2527986 RepID=A0A5C5YLI6_9BACT|nr:hypothetical protein CA13_73640 [Planctomycetes bacterium CA13]